MAAVAFVNCFEVPAGRDEAFVALWRDVNGYIAAKPGYVCHRLHRSLGPDAKFRFVNYAEWETAEDWRAAHDENFRQLVSRPEWAEFSSTHALCEVVHAGRAAAAPTSTPVVIRSEDGTRLDGRPSTVTIKVGAEHGAEFSVRIRGGRWVSGAAGAARPHSRGLGGVRAGRRSGICHRRALRSGPDPATWCCSRRGTRFAWSNPGEQPARFLAIYAPAGFERFFADLGEAVGDQPDAIGDPAAMGRIVRPLWNRYGIR